MAHLSWEMAYSLIGNPSTPESQQWDLFPGPFQVLGQTAPWSRKSRYILELFNWSRGQGFRSVGKIEGKQQQKRTGFTTLWRLKCQEGNRVISLEKAGDVEVETYDKILSWWGALRPQWNRFLENWQVHQSQSSNMLSSFCGPPLSQLEARHRDSSASLQTIRSIPWRKEK